MGAGMDSLPKTALYGWVEIVKATSPVPPRQTTSKLPNTAALSRYHRRCTGIPYGRQDGRTWYMKGRKAHVIMAMIHAVMLLW